MATEMAPPMEAVPPVETRRTQLKVIRENVESLSRDVVKFRKNHAVSSKRLEKQVASLQRDFASLKRDIAKDAARTRAKQEKMLSRILAKVSSRPKKRSSK